MERGAVYVLVNSSYPGLAKVGRTTRPASERVAELSGATGVPTPFVLAFEQDFADCARGERAVHADLDRLGWRIQPNREFFRGDTSDIIRIIQAHAAAEAGGTPGVPGAAPDVVRSRRDRAARLLAEGDCHLHGTGETLQDTAEAARLYQAAATAGSLVAIERLAMLYADHQTDRLAGRRRALRLLKLGVAAGNYYCLAAMGAIYARDYHIANFVKSWRQFFAARAAARCEEAEVEPGRFARACRTYITLCLDLGMEPQHSGVMADEADAIQLTLLDDMRQAGEDPEARYRLARVLRWSYEHLGPAAAPGCAVDQRMPAQPARRGLWRARAALAVSAG
jgi:hypothetical protein